MATSISKIRVSMPYKEESARVPVVIMLLAVVLISVPLVFWIMKINNEGSLSSNVEKFDVMISSVNSDIASVNAYLSNDEEAIAALQSRNAPVVTLIVPEVVIVEDRKKNRISPLKVSIDGIYWSAKNPLGGINNETYREGDVIQGYEIVRIGKTKVHFKAPDGTILAKDMYGDLLKGQ